MTGGLVDAAVSTLDSATQRSTVDETTGGPGGVAISAPMVAALEAAWAAIRARHPELPAVVIVLGAGSGDRGGALRLGHFAAMRWSPTDPTSDGTGAGAGLAEVFIGGEGLARGPVDVLGTLLHEAAHALAHVRGVQDTSRQGRWHNVRFKAIAEELGIAVEKDPKLGWSPTTVPDGPREAYAAVIAELGSALRMRRASETTGGGEKPKKPGPPALVCGCGRRIRASVSVREAGPIWCGVCEQEFTPETPADGDDNGDGQDNDDGEGAESGAEGW